MTTPPRRLDRIDIGILSQLQQNARITNAELARAVNLSPTPCFNRVRALEKLGLFRQRLFPLPFYPGLQSVGSGIRRARRANGTRI